MSTIWQELVKVALMGTERGRLSERTEQAFSKIGIDEDYPANRKLLEGAAVYHQFRKAALQLTDFEGELPQFAEGQTGLPCSPKSTHHLQLILQGRFRPALPEFVALLLENAKRLPPESLPALYDQSITDRRLWRQLEPAIGPAGKWLIAQNPEWEPLDTSADPEDWKTGRRLQRRKWLRRLHQEDPKEALAMLKAAWPTEDYQNKLAFLEVLAEDLRDEDASFLEECLDDRRKEVRQTAAALLSHLSGSELMDRLFRHAAGLLSLSEKGNLKVKFPESLDAALQRDGIEENPRQDYGAGRRAGYLLQMIARIPPHRWTEHFDTNAEGCLELFVRTDLKSGFVQVLTEAVLRHGGADWMEALFEYWSENDKEELWKNEPAKKLMRQFSDALFNRVAIRYLERRGPLVEEESPIGQLLMLRHHRWEDRLAVLVVQGFQNWMSDVSEYHWNTWHYKQLLKAVAYGCHSSLLDKFRKEWPVHSRIWPRWEDEVEQFLNVLLFRQEMCKELEKDGSR